MNKENSQFKTQRRPSRTEKAEWHTESNLEKSKCHRNTPDGLENFLNWTMPFQWEEVLSWPKIPPKELGTNTFTSQINYILCSSFS